MTDISTIKLNNFDVLYSIGKGSFGKVFLIKSKEDHKFYAAKVDKNVHNQEDGRTSLDREIEMYSKIRYPTILKFHKCHIMYIKSLPHFAFITDYIPKGSLYTVLENAQHALESPDWDDTARYIVLLGIALGMNYLHSKKIVHRDLKPANILINDNYYPLICDFGLSRIMDPMMKTVVGTQFYMAPEIFYHQPYTNKVDVYSFGLIAYELITEKRMPIEILEIRGEENSEFIRKCTSKDPSERPSFYDICQFIVSKSFMKAFNSIERERVADFLDLFVDDKYALYFYGCFLIENEDNGSKIQAADLFKSSADQGNVHAMIKYADMNRKGIGIDVNNETAAIYYKMAADKGNHIGMLHYFCMMQQCNKVEANRYFKMAIDNEMNGDVAMFDYAVMLKDGDGVSVNKRESKRYFKLALKKCDSNLMYKYANILYNGDGLDVDKKEAATYYKLSADKENYYAIAKYAFILKKGIGVKVNKSEAARYYKLSADKDNLISMYKYAKMLFKGDGVEINKREAANYYKMSADKGYIKSIMRYAEILNSSDDKYLFNKEEAAKYYKKAADKGDSIAIYKNICLWFIMVKES